MYIYKKPWSAIALPYREHHRMTRSAFLGKKMAKGSGLY